MGRKCLNLIRQAFYDIISLKTQSCQEICQYAGSLDVIAKTIWRIWHHNEKIPLTKIL